MGDEKKDLLKQEFHELNNLLNKITTNAGLVRYELKTKGIDSGKLDEERERLTVVFSDLEGYALEIAGLLKKLHKELL